MSNKQKLAVVKSVLRFNHEYITQFSEEIEGRVTEKLSQEFSRTESFILGAPSKLNKFLLNPQIRTHSKTVPGSFRNRNVENQGTNEDDSSWSRHLRQPDYTHIWPKSWPWHSDKSYWRHSQSPWHGDRSYRRHLHSPWHGDRSYKRHSQSPRHGDRSYRRDSQWPWHGDRRFGRDSQWTLHGGRSSDRESIYRPHMVTAVQEEIPYCSSGIFSEKQKKEHSTSQPQFRSEHTPATIEADQILLVLGD